MEGCSGGGSVLEVDDQVDTEPTAHQLSCDGDDEEVRS